MNLQEKLNRLEHLRDLVEKYVPIMYQSTDEGKKLHTEITEVYGEVADIFDQIVGKEEIVVPIRMGKAVYPNYFEAGFLSGRSIHSHQGKTQLSKVIGAVKTLVEKGAVSDSESSHGNRVFLVHGHDESAIQTCARFLEKLELPVTILREQPNKGMTILEKFIDHSDVGFAVVLLTGDDRGGTIDTGFEDQEPRARQNVILELGFFLGTLGRDRVCVLYEEGVEIPSDYNGVLFIPIDTRQAWKLDLAKEMKAAGLPVDLNNAV
ncbi:TIR domain-containing protein [Balneola vulgaris]|uniref:TIR domain-containing protein n=1 Tax=Balneola vulgaris TaxID=287535 RepID=UPI000363D37F|nr:nucleotide-binding protein [Balneola vulgaris]